jgi:hypothetical protein
MATLKLGATRKQFAVNTLHRHSLKENAMWNNFKGAWYSLIIHDVLLSNPGYVVYDKINRGNRTLFGINKITIPIIIMQLAI